MSADKPMIVYVLCLYLVGSAIYSLAILPWSAPAALLAMAIVFQLIKLASGVTLFFRVGIAPYLLAVVLLWSVVATLLGFRSHPVSQQSMYVITYTVISEAFLFAIVVYSFYLKRSGYFVGGPNA